MNPDIPSIRHVLSLDLSSLLISLGKEVDSFAEGAYPRSTSRLIELGKLWIQDHSGAIKDIICESSVVKKLVDDADQFQLVIAIADLVSALCIGVSPITVSAIIVKIGLKKVCRSVFPNSEL